MNTSRDARRGAPARVAAFAPVDLAGPSTDDSFTVRRPATVKKDEVKIDEVEVYSEPDDNVEIVDLDLVRTIDWMAPESLKSEKEGKGKKKLKRRDSYAKEGKIRSKLISAPNRISLSKSL